MSDARKIENLIARYAELVDTGDFTGVGGLFTDGVFRGSADFTGPDQVAGMLRDRVILYEDGTPRTHHVTTNLQIEVDNQAGTASARSYITVFQAVADLPLQPIIAGPTAGIRADVHPSGSCPAANSSQCL